MSTLIVPACGKSERYGLDRPKWSLKIGDTSMLEHSINYLKYNKLIFGFRHIDMSHVIESVNDKRVNFQMTFLHQTDHQIDTIRQVINSTRITGPILIKDCDNSFIPQEPYSGNFIAYTPLQGVVFNPEAKSYVQLNEYNEVVNIVEKKIISDKFCCGLYGFESVSEFMYYSDGCSYVSEVIFKMLLDKKIFTGVHCSDYIDWGTREAYDYYNSQERKE